MNIQTNWEVVTHHRCLLAEGPVWDESGKRIFWVDILQGEVRFFYPGSNEDRQFELGQMVGAIALRKSGGIVAALKTGFATIDIEKGTVHNISEVEGHLADNRFNDGKCDPAGRFWAGTMSISNTAPTGSLYVLEKDLTVNTRISGVTCSNGIAWSINHQTLYYIDSPTRNVVAYDYNMASGEITNGHVVIHIPAEGGFPDGMTIDTEGMLWIALWNGWKVARYDPASGKPLYEFNLPVSQVTSCIFGGDNMDDLYITSARTGLPENDLKEQQLAGALFVIKKCGFSGVETYRFGD